MQYSDLVALYLADNGLGGRVDLADEDAYYSAVQGPVFRIEWLGWVMSGGTAIRRMLFATWAPSVLGRT